jgi:hypothetical protein
MIDRDEKIPQAGALSDADAFRDDVAWERAPLFGRRETILRALRQLDDLCRGRRERPCIVETGTLRNEDASGCAGDGWSTIAWGWYCAARRGRAWTVDVSAGALDVCRRMTAPYAGSIEYVHASSLDFFRWWAEEEPGPIHLLYLDSLDYTDAEASEAHHRAEAKAALPHLAAPCLVLFDDTAPAEEPGPDGAPRFHGKGARAIPFLLAQGFRVEWAEEGQVLLARGGGAP